MISDTHKNQFFEICAALVAKKRVLALAYAKKFDEIETLLPFCRTAAARDELQESILATRRQHIRQLQEINQQIENISWLLAV